jgi:hypothetical protein
VRPVGIDVVGVEGQLAFEPGPVSNGVDDDHVTIASSSSRSLRTASHQSTRGPSFP